MAAIVAAPFGTLPDGRQVDAYRLSNDHGMSVTVLTYGGILQSVEVPDAIGHARNVALGFRRLEDYLPNTAYFGAIIGRVASRIANGTFVLDGIRYSLPVNAPPTSLHGGQHGFHTKLWAATPETDVHSVALKLHRASPDAEEGYPGTLDTTVVYRLLAGSNTLRVEYQATTDAPTIVNLTNHSYFNLRGEGQGTVLDHEVQIFADSYLPIGRDLIPTGEVDGVGGTPLDFRTPHRIGERIREGFDQLLLAQGYDHNYVLGDTDRGAPRRAARVLEPVSRRVLEVWTTEPGIDFYTGNFLDGTLVGTSGSIYRQSDGFAIEPEHFSDSPNQPQFPSIVLRPGQLYDSRSEFRFSTA